MNSQVKRYPEGPEGSQGAGTFVPVEFGVCHSLALGCTHQPESSLNPLFKFFMEVPLLMAYDLISKLFSPPEGLVDGWDRKFQPSNHLIGHPPTVIWPR